MSVNPSEVRRRSKRYVVSLPGNEVKKLSDCSTEEVMHIAMDLIDDARRTVKVLSVANISPNKYRKV